MRIENHRLVSTDDRVELRHRWAPGRIYALTPRRIVIHFGVTANVDATVGAQFASNLFYHVSVDGFRRGLHDAPTLQVVQVVPFNLQGAHAKGFNADSIGICIANPGPLIRCSDGRLRTTYNERAFRAGQRNAPAWPEDDAIEATHASGLAPRNWTHWAVYTYEERDIVLELCELLVSQYPTIREICGHDYLSPGNKFDPGPAGEDLIMASIRGAFPNLNVPAVVSQDSQ